MKKKERVMKCHGVSKAIKNLRQGQSVWFVTVHENHAIKEVHVKKYIVQSRTYNSYGLGLFLDLKYKPVFVKSDKLISCSRSLLDANFSTEQNWYNKHKLFTSKRKAESYAKLIRQGTAVNG